MQRWIVTSYERAGRNSSVKGRVMEDNVNNKQPALGEEGDFAVHASACGKVQAEPNVNPKRTNREEKKEKDACCLP